MAKSLCYSSETITTLLISYTPIQNKVLKKRKLDDYSHSNVICNWIKFGVWLRKKIQLPVLWRVVYYYLWIKTRPTYYYFSRKLKGIKISIWLKIYSGCLFQVFIIILILIFAHHGVFLHRFWLLLIFLATPCSIRDLSSPTRDRTHASYSGSVESQPRGCQWSPYCKYFSNILKLLCILSGRINRTKP